MVPLIPIIILGLAQTYALNAADCKKCTEEYVPQLVQIAVKGNEPLKVYVNCQEFKCQCGRDPVMFYVSNEGELLGYCEECMLNEDVDDEDCE
jgi:hypothetical protein